MIFKHFIFILFLALLASNILAEETPTILLNEGTNEISLSVFNNKNMDITNVKIEVDKKKLPSWLTIPETNQKIDVPRGRIGVEKFCLTFEVIDPPLDACAEIPYILKDNNGNEWNFVVNVQLDSNIESIPKTVNALYENFPNPFNPITTINYSLKKEGLAKLVIYNSLGQEIRTLVNDHQKAGIHTVQWDGRNNNGQQVSSGLYLYQLKVGSFIKTQRMMLVE